MLLNHWSARRQLAAPAGVSGKGSTVEDADIMLICVMNDAQYRLLINSKTS
jgi:hypothetical protein